MKRHPYLLLALVVCLALPAVAVAQTLSQPGVDLPPVEVTAAVLLMQTPPSPSNSSFIGAWFAAAIDANVKKNFAATTAIEGYPHHATKLLGGGQVSTDFFYGSSRDLTPGRFFARALAGATRIRSEGLHPAAQIIGGIDVLLSRTGSVGFRFDVGYEFVGGSVPHHADRRVGLGLIFGPHLKR